MPDPKKKKKKDNNDPYSLKEIQKSYPNAIAVYPRKNSLGSTVMFKGGGTVSLNRCRYTQKQESNLYKYGVIYFGTLLMMISPFVIDSIYGKMGMMIGLILITIQTQKTKQYNLSLLNLVGFIGYLFALIKSIL